MRRVEGTRDPSGSALAPRLQAKKIGRPLRKHSLVHRTSPLYLETSDFGGDFEHVSTLMS